MRPSIRAALFFAFITAAGVTLAGAKIAAFVPELVAPKMVSHKALYTFRMVSMEQGAAISGINGKMYFEQDDACDAWTTDQRFTTEYYYPERKPLANTSRYVAWEAKDGSLFHFSSEKQEGQAITEQLRGSVERREDGTATAQFSRPEDLSFKLDKGYMLPMSHTIETIRRAKAGEKFFTTVLFDGTDADGPVEVGTFIGKKLTADEMKKISADGKKIDEKLLGTEAWHVRIAFFPIKEEDSPLPVYEMDSITHDNGVISWALVDYKSFKVEQKMEALEPLAVKACP